MRDFTTIHPNSPIQFCYSEAGKSGNQEDADWIQNGFNIFEEKNGIDYPYQITFKISLKPLKIRSRLYLWNFLKKIVQLKNLEMELSF